nr:forkhead box protein O3-like isoform X2 [Misgurnus anguillicaudatus]
MLILAFRFLFVRSLISSADLYKNGLQRVNFVPFIAVLKHYCHTLRLDSGIDYRKRNRPAAGKLFYLSSEPDVNATLDKLFDELAFKQNDITRPRSLKVNGRTLTLNKACGTIADCTFEELCDRPVGASDYLEISSVFDTVFIRNIPLLTLNKKTQARRFITLIDALYEHKVRVVLHAETVLDELFVHNGHHNDHHDTHVLLDDLGISRNSIRHNLSLHSRFVRVQNEGTGKSSWWMVNPDGGKGGKAPRRRAVSMDNSNKLIKSARGRAAKKKAALQATQDGSSESSSSLSKWTGSPTSRSSDELDAWTDFRSRTNSNASTLSGRLSPILANLEVDEVPDDDSPLSPMLYSSPSSMSPSTGLTELPRLADLAGTMNLNDGLSDNLMDDLLDNISLTASQSPGQDESGTNLQGSPVFTFSCSGSSLAIPSGSYGSNSMFSPPSVTGLRQSPMQTIQENTQATFSCSSLFSEQSLQDLLGSETHGRSDVLLTHSDPLISQASASLSSQNSRRSGLLLRNDPMMSNQAGPGGQSGHKKASPSGWRLNSVSSGESDYQSLMKQHVQQSPFRSTSMQLNSDSLLTGLNGSVTSVQSASQDRFPSDLDLEAFSGGLDCDMDAITRNDLMDAEGLEFSFDSHLISSQNANLTNTKRTSSQSWVPGLSGPGM